MEVYGDEEVKKFLQRMKRRKLTKTDKELLRLAYCVDRGGEIVWRV